MTNDALFELYQSELTLRIHNRRNLANDNALLDKFKTYLGGYPPSPQLAKGFLATFKDRKPRTIQRHASTIKGFMKWYGEPMDDLKIKVPKSLPPYIEDDDIKKLLNTMRAKQTHKDCTDRDVLMVELAIKTGLRRAELANLTPNDVHSEFLVVRQGKGGKDRPVPLASSIGTRLHTFIRNMPPDQPIFGLTPGSISNKIKQWTRKAGLTSIHAHSLRHKFATDLLERGVNVRVVQELMGHENLNTTQVYLGITDQAMKEAVRRLDEKPKQPNDVTLRTVKAGDIKFTGDPRYEYFIGSARVR